MPAPTIQYSPEQEKIFQAQDGGYIVVANAGTGKTTSTAELIVRCYENEERKRFGSKGRATGAQQIRLLDQFRCVTFTVKAAASLDEKIKELFAEKGIPSPTTSFGKPYRIARTLDSLVQQWLRNPAVFKAWMATDKDTADRIKAVLPLLPPDSIAALKASGKGQDMGYLFSVKWPWIADHDVSSMLLDLCLRHEEHNPLAGCDVNAWAASFDTHLAQVAMGENGRFQSDFWEMPLGVWRTHRDEIKRLDHDLHQGAVFDEASREKALAQVLAWDRFTQTKDEFIAVHELARARGFHPIYSPERVTARAIEEQLAAGEHLTSYRRFLSVASRWHRLKTHFLLREFGDQTTAFVRACENFPELLERAEEYPRLVRRKYVFWDEVQDNSDFQHRILKFFYGRGGVPYLSMAIGDPKQQIYCWRGASPRGFLSMIERKRGREPGKLLGLTCSFRSAKRIVALGNEIIQTLPSYRESVLPSTTIYADEGHVEVSKPCVSLDEEAEWAIDILEHKLRTTNDTVMLVSRSDISDHPIFFRHLHNHPELNRRISCLTIHRSKGLEADSVIILGIVAGKLPDYRANSDEEVNLFYVACTRAKKSLYLSGLIAKREINDAGKIEDKIVGPSPFFARLPSLRELCIESGWTAGLLKEGIDAQNQLLAVHITKMDKNRGELIRERRELFPEVEVQPDAGDGPTDYGVTDAHPGVATMPRRTLGTPDPAGVKTNMVSAKLRDRVLSKLLSAYRMLPDRVPRLSTDEFSVARRSNWIAKSPHGKNWIFTEALAARAQQKFTTDPWLGAKAE
jgi:superfamily I DNA/RNA helicase